MQLNDNLQALIGDTGNVVLLRSLVALVASRAPNGVWSVQALTLGPSVNLRDGLKSDTEAQQGVLEALALIAPQLAAPEVGAPQGAVPIATPPRP